MFLQYLSLRDSMHRPPLKNHSDNFVLMFILPEGSKTIIHGPANQPKVLWTIGSLFNSHFPEEHGAHTRPNQRTGTEDMDEWLNTASDNRRGKALTVREVE